MRRYKVCPDCHMAFDKNLDHCPSCKKKIGDMDAPRPEYTEGSGRRFRAGGAACDYCPHCCGSSDWCPIMGD